ncbi:MAG: hypothetical protein PHF51_02200 [Candidatus ainarchaeum sp.]|nr:hypothetical protein [Candidatus ainarchaeum sp.]
MPVTNKGAVTGHDVRKAVQDTPIDSLLRKEFPKIMATGQGPEFDLIFAAKLNRWERVVHAWADVKNPELRGVAQRLFSLLEHHSRVFGLDDVLDGPADKSKALMAQQLWKLSSMGSVNGEIGEKAKNYFLRCCEGAIADELHMANASEALRQRRDNRRYEP